MEGIFIIFREKKNKKFLYAGIVLITVLLFGAASCAHQVDEAEQPVEPAEVEAAAAPEQPEAEQPMPMPEFEAPAEIDEFEEIRPELEQYLVQQKQNELLMQHLSDLRSDAEVESFMSDADFSDEDSTIALVNGETIPMGDLLLMEQQELQQMYMRGLQQGSDQEQEIIASIRPQILEDLISVLLVQQQAERDGIIAEEDEIEEMYQQYVQQFGGEQQLQQQLSMAGITEEELRNYIAEQIPLQKYLEQFYATHLSEEDLSFTEEELRALYEQLLQQQQQQR